MARKSLVETEDASVTKVNSAPEIAERPGDPASPDRILELASGFMAAKHLFAANELGVFEALSGSQTTIEGLAARTGLPRRAVRISADAMVALGLLEREGDSYRNSKTADAFLAGESAEDLRPVLRLWDKISYPTWEGLADALRRGPSTEVFELDDELQQVVAAGIEAHAAGPIAALARTFDFSANRRLLDIGGGTGSWSIAIAEEYPRLDAAILELPAVAEIARERVAEAGLESRIDVIAVDAMTGQLPSGYDIFLLANLVAYFSPEENRSLLERVRSTAETASRLLFVDFWTNTTHTEPHAAALMAGEFAVHLRNGDVYSIDEVRGWLEDTGWRFVEHAALVGGQSVVVAEVAE